MKTHETSPMDDPAKVVIIDDRSIIKVGVLLHELPPSFPQEFFFKTSKIIMYDTTFWTLNT